MTRSVSDETACTLEALGRTDVGEQVEMLADGAAGVEGRAVRLGVAGAVVGPEQPAVQPARASEGLVGHGGAVLSMAAAPSGSGAQSTVGRPATAAVAASTTGRPRARSPGRCRPRGRRAGSVACRGHLAPPFGGPSRVVIVPVNWSTCQPLAGCVRYEHMTTTGPDRPEPRETPPWRSRAGCSTTSCRARSSPGSGSSECRLAESLGVGRSLVREALKSLHLLGLLEVRQGDGTYLKRTDSDCCRR